MHRYPQPTPVYGADRKTSDCFRIKMSNALSGTGCFQGHFYRGGDEQRRRLELFWLGSTRPTNTCARRTNGSRHEAGLMRSVVAAKLAAVQPENVDRMRTVLEAHRCTEAIGKDW